MFENNEGAVDRTLRIMAGLILVVAFFLFPKSAWRFWALIGLYPLVTGMLGTCPIYTLFGISTEIENSEDMK